MQRQILQHAYVNACLLMLLRKDTDVLMGNVKIECASGQPLLILLLRSLICRNIRNSNISQQFQSKTQ